MEVEETIVVLDTHCLTDRELAILLTATHKTIPEAQTLLKQSLGFVSVNMMGKGFAPLINASVAGVQFLDDGSLRLTHMREPSSIKDPEILLNVIDKLTLSIDFEVWVEMIVYLGLRDTMKAALDGLGHLLALAAKTDKTDVVIGRKLRDPEHDEYPLENLL
ncbi:hypothetical protein Kuja_0220 [Vibrio phage vB_VchM_Kuja]|uniref:Uncharacterized protein n=1 Tax=Vibrio phage vB_VchM_Kuja TaxID=2686437 RepID=A0A6B9J908_9CAUD|nr:hypothetical protein HWC83_gp022 [Vibrio phage vB_VchM_Kuja]QGZ16013.1 hypothetical protein Kuja_0220 [Vibrio phage vB_VchM_Kuja]